MDDPRLVEDETMMRRPIVHIGYHKTATTWFQRQFYPRVRNGRYIPQLDVIRAFKAYDMWSPDNAALRRALGGDDPTTPQIISDESLCGSFQEAIMRGTAGWAKAHVIATVMPDADIVIFVRSQPEMLVATYIEYVRAGGIALPATVFGLDGPTADPSFRSETIPSPNLAHFEYDRLIARYDELFGTERVHVFLYEDFRCDPDAFLRQFAKRLSFDIDLDGLAMARENTGYRHRVVKLARAVNHVCQGQGGQAAPINIPGLYLFSRTLLHRLNAFPALGRSPTPAELFGADALAELEARYAPSNRRLAASRDLALSENGYPL